jgi:hypothetical protein
VSWKIKFEKRVNVCVFFLICVILFLQMFSCPVAVFPRLKRELIRYQTFFSNPLQPWSTAINGVDPIMLAAAGFYYYNDESYVQCAFCGVTIGYWQAGENPIAVHKHCYPLCPFMNGEDVGNIPFDYYERCEMYD